CQKYSSTPLTF
nr:immunoglobulin light chain junction region [Macaca mulatta]MOW62206.1 immunoglobulin light chain junction region [Macaca mulatta]MOW62299.1 immunoglobulin light chain junction region [Macaca mulatta]MOW62542.1 immunoglobulin light chain junction region [Macaca mulatta]MOW63438.1 immunoglobulin light chain junction region [Macaca mulatta]